MFLIVFAIAGLMGGIMLGGLFSAIGGVLLGGWIGYMVDADSDRARSLKQIEKKRAKELQEAADLKADLAKHEEVLQLARQKYPDHRDKEMLVIEDGQGTWPEDIFYEVFELPDVVITYETRSGQPGEVHLWSPETIAVNEKDRRYQQHLREIEWEREREAEARRQREERERREAEELAAKKAKQIIVSFDQLKR